MTYNFRRNKQQGAVMLIVMASMAALMLMAATVINYFITIESNDVEMSLSEIRTYWAMMGHLNYMASRAGGQGVCDAGGNADTYATMVKAFCGGGIDDTGNVGTVYSTAFYSPGANVTFAGRTVTSAAGSLQSYLMEIDNRDKTGTQNPPALGVPTDPGSRRWVYPQDANPGALNINAPYHITIRALLRDRRTVSAAPDYSGDYVPLRMDATVVDSGDNTIPILNGLADRADRLTVGFCATDSETDPGVDPTKFKDRGCDWLPGLATPNEGIVYSQFIMRNAPIPIPKQ